VLDILFDLRTLANRDEPYQVISRYRSLGTDAPLRSRSSGVAQHSLHVEARAIDVRLGGSPARKLHEFGMRMQRACVGFYSESEFVHLDTGTVQSW
jgi:uncharacterized protein YcbK (DUF882 family)